ncbi:ABC transporter substrate-binding protein [Micromonospora endophytica]|uniref:Amino acid ABC transporter substrate-binding protein n=1 Tax=Micromonospora endophytica TaxID=515350 RepID=A0A2W2DHV0_9ACTN|nr:ABC transporter substrate-binding protein [Micromonospora endophytica]PZG00350.1 amino acid ABC transporter substrate-binding protein [Micromonospora endophytica]RIW49910.1 amino acid ABC transporter substrate-binding protein [Micromonospora endophytica]BCJ57142.1 amino acid ABC transporter substrate-binding protein [Micromonospora endophytica]
MVSTSRTLTLAAAGAVLLAAGACTPQATPAPLPSGSATCTKESLPTRTPGKLTIATDEPAYQPWFVDDKPDNGEGFESAVAYAVAEKLGYARDEVVWTRVRFDSAIAPGPKEFDFDINQFSITDERKQAVDFSAPYYLVRQTIIALKSSKIAGKTALADLKDAKLGAQVGTTSYQAITDVIKPTVEPQVYNSNDDAKKALQNGQLDGLVVDLPTAFYITAAEIDDAVIVGQLPQVGTPEAFGLLLDKDSPLTGCVSGAVGQLSADGVLKQLEQQWLAQVAGAPELT